MALVRKQVLYREEQAQKAEELAMLLNVSMSSIYRDIFDEGVKIKKNVVRKKKKLSPVSFMLSQAKKAVTGPGDSEYDKYAYDF